MRKTKGPDGKPALERTARYGKGMRYRARYADPEGSERSQSFPDGRKKEAAAWAADQEAAVRRGTWIDPESGRMTLRRFTEEVYLPAMTTNVTTQERVSATLRLHVLKPLGAKPLGYLAAHPSVIQQWVRGLNMAPSSARVVLSVLSGVLTAAVDDNLIPRNPCRGRKVRAPDRPDRLVIPWPAPRVAAVRAALAPRFRATADAGAGLGLRQAEMFGLSPDDVDWLRGVVHVRRQAKIAGGSACFAPPKGGRDRDVPLTESVKEALSAHVRDYPPAEVTLPWVTPGGDPVTVSLMFTTGHGRVLRRSGLPRDRRNGFHALRHRFASVALAAGADPRKLSAWLGHHDPGFTLRTYCHLMPEGDDRMRRRLDEALRAEDIGPETARESGGLAP